MVKRLAKRVNARTLAQRLSRNERFQETVSTLTSMTVSQLEVIGQMSAEDIESIQTLSPRARRRIGVDRIQMMLESQGVSLDIVQEHTQAIREIAQDLGITEVKRADRLVVLQQALQQSRSGGYALPRMLDYELHVIEDDYDDPDPLNDDMDQNDGVDPDDTPGVEDDTLESDTPSTVNDEALENAGRGSEGGGCSTVTNNSTHGLWLVAIVLGLGLRRPRNLAQRATRS